MHTIHDDDVGCLRIEEHPEHGLIMHVDIYKWSKAAFKHVERVFDSFLVALSENGIEHLSAVIPTEDRKNQKFAIAYGFIRTGTQMTLIDKPEIKYELWRITTGLV